MSDFETDCECASENHDLQQDRPTKGTPDTRSYIRRTRVNTCDRQLINSQRVLLTETELKLDRKPQSWHSRSPADIFRRAQRREENRSLHSPNDFHESKHCLNDDDRNIERVKRRLVTILDWNRWKKLSRLNIWKTQVRHLTSRKANCIIKS